MKFSIPSSFSLGGSEIKVVYVKQCTDKDSNVDGLSIYGKTRIELKIDDSFSNDYKEYVFFHELVHFVYGAMESNDLRSDEREVSLFATFLQQAIKSMK